MEINYKKIVFNKNYINFIFKTVAIVFVFNLALILSILLILGSAHNYAQSMNSVRLLKHYIRGGVVNPYSFIRTAKIYQSLGMDENEIIELEYALVLYKNQKYNDVNQIVAIENRIKILKIKLEK